MRGDPARAAGLSGRDPMVSVRGLRRSFRTRGAGGRVVEIQALRGVDLDLFPGECLALVGESGSGKTTLARIILDLIEPSEGNVLFQGRNLAHLPPAERRTFRRQAQIVFQDPFGSLNPRMRAGTMLEEILRVHRRGESRAQRMERVAELLELVGLPAAAIHRFPHQFSGGQRQRLGIARALSVEPELLILDEPVSALDLSVQAQILNLLRDLQRVLGLTYLLVAHDLSVVRQVADRVAVLYLGRIMEVGPAPAILADPKHPYTRGLLAAADPEGVEVAKGTCLPLLPGDPPSPVNPPRGCALFSRCPNPLKDRECRENQPTLEPVDEGRRGACWKVGKQAART